MTAKLFPCLFMSALLISISSVSFGQNGWWTILKGGPFADFRDDDWNIFRDAVTHAADGANQGSSHAWSNAKTGTHGDVMVERAFDRQDLGACRDLTGRVAAKTRNGSFQITLCRKSGEPWRIAP